MTRLTQHGWSQVKYSCKKCRSEVGLVESGPGTDWLAPTGLPSLECVRLPHHVTARSTFFHYTVYTLLVYSP